MYKTEEQQNSVSPLYFEYSGISTSGKKLTTRLSTNRWPKNVLMSVSRQNLPSVIVHFKADSAMLCFKISARITPSMHSYPGRLRHTGKTALSVRAAGDIPFAFCIPKNWHPPEQSALCWPARPATAAWRFYRNLKPVTIHLKANSRKLLSRLQRARNESMIRTCQWSEFEFPGHKFWLANIRAWPSCCSKCQL